MCVGGFAEALNICMYFIGSWNVAAFVMNLFLSSNTAESTINSGIRPAAKNYGVSTIWRWGGTAETVRPIRIFLRFVVPDADP